MYGVVEKGVPGDERTPRSEGIMPFSTPSCERMTDKLQNCVVNFYDIGFGILPRVVLELVLAQFAIWPERLQGRESSAPSGKVS